MPFSSRIALYFAFIVRQRTARTPLMDLRLLTRRPVAAGIFLIFTATALMIAGFFLGSFYFQQHLGTGCCSCRWRSRP